MHSITFEYHRYFTRKISHSCRHYLFTRIHTYTLIQTVRDTSINNAHAHLVFNLLHMLDTDLLQTHLVNSHFIFPCCCCCCCCCCCRCCGILASRSKDQLHEHKKSYLSSTENSAGKTLEGAVLQNLKDLLQQSHKAKERDNGKSRPASAPLLYVVSLGRSKYSDNHPLSLFLLVETWPPKATPNPWSSQRRWSPRKVEVY